MWLKTQRGNLVNLELTTAIHVGFHPDPERSGLNRVYASSASDGETMGVVLFDGPTEECRAYMTWLAGQLPLVAGANGTEGGGT